MHPNPTFSWVRLSASWLLKLFEFGQRHLRVVSGHVHALPRSALKWISWVSVFQSSSICLARLSLPQTLIHFFTRTQSKSIAFHSFYICKKNSYILRWFWYLDFEIWVFAFYFGIFTIVVEILNFFGTFWLSYVAFVALCLMLALCDIYLLYLGMFLWSSLTLWVF